MDKKLNTVLFFIAATIANIIIMLFLSGLLLFIFARFLAPLLPPLVNQLLLVCILIGSVVLTYFIYHKVMRLLLRKYDFEKYFSPLIKRNKKNGF